MPTKRVRLTKAWCDWSESGVRDFIDLPEDFAANHFPQQSFGPLGVTECLVHWLRACYPDSWLTLLPGAMLRTPGIDLADLVGELIDQAICASGPPPQQLVTAMRDLLKNGVPDRLARCYWPAGALSANTCEANLKQLQELGGNEPVTVFGALAGKHGVEAGNGVLRIQVMTEEADEWDMQVVPWSRYVPDEESLRFSRERLAKAVQHAPLLADLPPRRVLLDFQPPAENAPAEAVSQALDFEGCSYSLAAVLALYAFEQGRSLACWSTGELQANGVDIGYVEGMADKLGALQHLLDRTSEVDVRHAFLPRANEGDVNAFSLPRDVEAVYVNTIDDLLRPERLFDPFRIEMAPLNEFYRRAGACDARPPSPEDAFCAGLVAPDPGPDLQRLRDEYEVGSAGERLAKAWLSGEGNMANSGAAKALLCVPYQAQQRDAQKLLKWTACRLKGFLRWARAMHQQENVSTRFPVPVTLDLSQLSSPAGDHDGIHASRILEALSACNGELAHTDHATCSDVDLKSALRLALQQSFRLALIVFDARVADSRLLEASERVWPQLRVLLEHVLCGHANRAMKRQSLVLIAPDVHVQLFWQRELEQLGVSVSQIPLVATSAPPR